jgi:hypothetical protein
MDQRSNKRAVLHFRGFLTKLEFSSTQRQEYDRMTDRVTDRGILDKYMININFAERNSEAAMGKVGSGGHYIF